MKAASRPHRIIFYSDEKNFVLDPPFNPQNDRWIRFEDNDDELEDPDNQDGHGNAATAAIAAPPAGKYVPWSKHPGSSMFLGVVASTGEVSPPIWFKEGFRLTAKDYIESLRTVLIPWMRRVAAAHGNVPFTFY